MDIRNTSGVLESLLAPTKSANKQNNAQSSDVPRTNTGTAVDIINVKNNNGTALKSKASKLISEDLEKIDNGFRRVQEFETAKGQKFTRIEEVTITPDQTKRLVIQQNESGSINILENIFDRQDNGNFRQTQRFTNEAGETQTNIEFNVAGDNANQLLGIPPSPGDKPRQPFEPVRGTQYNIQV